VPSSASLRCCYKTILSFLCQVRLGLSKKVRIHSVSLCTCDTYNKKAGLPSLHVHLCADEIVVATIEPRTGKISLRDTGDLGAAGRAPRFVAISEKLNENPTVLLIDALTRLRIMVCDLCLPQASSMLINVLLDNRRAGRAKSELSGPSDIQATQFPALG